jgi:hypothetical protein
MDATLLQMLFSKEDEHVEEDVDFSWESMKTNPKYAARLPKHVHELVSPHFRETHWKIVDMACNTEKVFPSSLMHPLRSVEVIKPDGDAILANISIGVLTQVWQPPQAEIHCSMHAIACFQQCMKKSWKWLLPPFADYIKHSKMHYIIKDYEMHAFEDYIITDYTV